MDAKTLNKLKFHLDRVVLGTSPSLDEDWSKIARLVDDALAAAPDPTSVELRRLLEDQRARCATRRLVDNVYALQSEIERVAKSGAHKEAKPRGALTPKERVAELLRGRTIVVVGGDPRPEHAERLKTAFELREVLWPETSRTNPSVSGLEPYVARADVALVLMLIRFVRHGVNWDLPDVCSRHDVPLVRVPAGYNEDTLATLILEQAGKRLGGRPQ